MVTVSPAFSVTLRGLVTTRSILTMAVRADFCTDARLDSPICPMVATNTKAAWDLSASGDCARAARSATAEKPRLTVAAIRRRFMTTSPATLPYDGEADVKRVD